MIVADKSTLHGECRLAEKKDTFPGSNRKVRRVTIRKKVYKEERKVQQYSSAKDITVSRSVNRLALELPVDYNPHQEQ